MEIPDNLNLASMFMIFSILWFSHNIGAMKKPYKIKFFLSLLLASVVFVIFSIITKDIAFPLYLMMIIMVVFLVSFKHFGDLYGDTYGKIDVFSFFKKKNSNKQKKDMD